VVVGFPPSLAVEEAAEAEVRVWVQEGWVGLEGLRELGVMARVEEAVVVSGGKAVQTRFYHGRQRPPSDSILTICSHQDDRDHPQYANTSFTALA
jgi:hypothetical protein